MTTEQQAPPEGAVVQEEPKIPGATYAGFCHVGPGAEACQEGEKGTCGDPMHFHAFCRLPNAMQMQEIRDRADAARARRIRMLRDEESDAYTILEGALYELERTGDREAMIDEIVAKDWFKDHHEAMEAVAERDEFKGIEHDQDQFRKLDDMPEGDRDDDEWRSLSNHVAEFGDAVERERENLQKPKRDALIDKPVGEIITMIREDRINAEAQVIAMQFFSQWQWFYGTLKPVPEGRPKQRVWGSFEELRDEDATIIEALNDTFTGLERESAPPPP